VLGSVLLVVTGAEALYADVGHFGPSPIRRAWFVVVLPGLALNYLGQGALLLQRPSTIENPFYDLVPRMALIPVVVLATAATVIASQALISGTFSLTSQAIQLGYCPRLAVLHTSASVRGQIYVPAVNWAMMIACLLLVATFRSSSGLAAAYGVAVASTMLITTILAFFVVRSRWGWPLGAAVILFATLLSIDLAFFLASLVKIRDGGWIPLALAGAVFTVMSTWNSGRTALAHALKDDSVSVERTLENIRRSRPTRVSGNAVFLMRSPDAMPIVLLHHLKHNKVLHERVVLLTLLHEEVPYASEEERISIRELGDGFWRVVARYGFMETPQVPDVMDLCRVQGLDLAPMDTTFILGRETLLTGGKSPLPKWRKRLFSFLSRNAMPATRFFGLPPNRVVELGRQVEL
jgi:KUP system potassium uptake protein